MVGAKSQSQKESNQKVLESNKNSIGPDPTVLCTFVFGFLELLSNFDIVFDSFDIVFYYVFELFSNVDVVLTFVDFVHMFLLTYFFGLISLVFDFLLRLIYFFGLFHLTCPFDMFVDLYLPFCSMRLSGPLPYERCLLYNLGIQMDPVILNPRGFR